VAHEKNRNEVKNTQLENGDYKVQLLVNGNYSAFRFGHHLYVLVYLDNWIKWIRLTQPKHIFLNNHVYLPNSSNAILLEMKACVYHGNFMSI